MNINMRSVLLILVALVIAGITALMARSLVSSEPTQLATEGAPAPKAQSTQSILVTREDLQAGHILQAGDLRWVPWPEEGLNKQYIQKSQGKKRDAFAGAVLRNSIMSGQPLVEDFVVRPGNRGFMAAVLTPGARAVSIKVNATTGIAGFIFPGDHVDVILTHQIPSPGEDRSSVQASETVLSNIRVLAIDQRTENTNNTPSIGKTVTVEVTPKDAEKIALVSKLGELSLSLRSLAIDKDSAKQRESYTWDSEVSKLLPGSGSGGQSFKVNVVRGKEVEALGFRRQ
ncbi:MAG: Flp pilus assembly protein CpaB [Kordiimonas sp.]|nr:Flp pilus assembly protein CpaB [Kordiimonas sp.]